jgi:DNA-binding GntR family transcriptional regulator
MKSLADQVYERLRLTIVDGELAPGARVVELEIANSMGTSQGPVREALQRLEREGLVQRQAHSATFVTEFSVDEMYELFSIRSVIEGFAIQRAVARITDEQCARLETLVNLMREAGLRDDMLTLTESDLQFHRLICQWSGSATLQRAWEPLYSQIQRFVVRTHKNYFASLTDIADTHMPIVQALRQHDEQNVTRLIQEHVMLIWSLFGQKEKHAKEQANATARDSAAE